MAVSRSTVAIVAVALILGGTSLWRIYQTRDAQQIAGFLARRTDYEALVSMLRDDKQLTFINRGLTEPDDPAAVGIPPQRLAEYRRLMKKIDCVAIRYIPSMDRAGFVAEYFFGWTDRDFLFAAHATPMPDFHHIEGNWYWAPSKWL
jgi:hypothetical protein